MNDALFPAGLFLVSLAALQVRIVRYVTYPPALLCGVWGLALLWLLATGQRYVPVSAFTVGIYVSGALAFSVGGAFGWGVAAPLRSPTRIDAVAPVWLIPMLTLIVIVVAPLFALKLLAVVGAMSPVDLLYAVRVESLQTAVGDTVGVVQNIVPFAMMSAWAAIALPPLTFIGRISRAVLVTAAVGVTILTGSRGAPLTLLLGLGFIGSVRAQRLPVLRGAAVAMAAVVLFGVMAVLLRKGSASPEATFGENILAASEGLEDYALGGIVAFDGIRSDPGRVPEVWNPLRTVQEMANRLGARYEVPSKHAEYSLIGDGILTNVYTMYFSYYPAAGFAGTLGLVFMVGLMAGFAHRCAVQGSFVAVLFHGVLAASVLQSIFNEPFYSNANFLLKLTLFGFLMTSVLQRRWSLPLGAAELERSGP